MDTRVYLAPREFPDDADPCVGCIIGKNPGSATPSRIGRRPVAIALSGDRFLPNVRAIVTKAYAVAGAALPPAGYVRVLNLFYLCDRDLKTALATLKTTRSLPACATEKNQYPWAWFAWGGDDHRLNAMKSRFDALSADHHFYCGGKDQGVIDRIPGTHDMARHTQGMHHGPVVAHLASLVAAQYEER